MEENLEESLCKGDKLCSQNFEEFTEGKVKISCIGSPTFYNPVQEFNRDLTICILRQFVDDRDAQNSNGYTNSNYAKMGEEPSAKRSKTAGRHPESVGKIRIIDALSASGLRALRFAKEVAGVGSVLANDFSEQAVEAIEKNIKVNGVEDLVSASYGDAVDVLMSHRTYEKRFHAVDLDPYGSAAVFLDSAVQAVTDGGILMVTCTDTATLCGNTPEACFNKYGSVPLRHKSCHEMALRILLKSIDSHASRHGRFIKPLLSISVDFYVRCFVKLDSSARLAKDCASKLSHVFACSSCHSLEFQPVIKKTVNGPSIRFTNSSFHSSMIVNTLQEPKQGGEAEAPGSCCVHCGAKAIHMAGPIYSAPMHDPEFVKRLLEGIKKTPENLRLGTHDRMLGVLTVVSEEIHGVPLYYEHDQLMNVVKCTVPKHLFVRSAIINAGFKCSISHCNPKALKTDAPVTFLWDIARYWAKKNNVNPEKFPVGSAAKNILSVKNSFEISFTTNPLAIPRSRTDCLLRFQDNKGKNWGPRSKAKGSVTSSTAGFQKRSNDLKK